MTDSKQKIGGGLKETPLDKRDFSLGAIYGIDRKIPDFDFVIGEMKVEHQFDTDFCVGAATGVASGKQEKQRLNWIWPWAWAKKESGDVGGFGLDLRAGMRAHVKVGAPAYDPAFSLETQTPEFLRYIENYPKEYFNEAKYHAKKAYYAVDGFPSVYDSIVSALWRFKNEERWVVSGALWREAWTRAEGGILPAYVGNDGIFGHAFCFKGQKFIGGKPHLIAHLSNGENIGDKGLFYFPKNLVDKVCTYGSYMFKDYPLGLTQESIIERSRWFKMGFYEKAWNLTKKFFFL